MSHKFHQSVVVITGASSGIGEALAYEFARLGAKLVLGARKLDALQLVAVKAEKLGSPKAIAVATDVTSEESCKALIETAVNSF